MIDPNWAGWRSPMAETGTPGTDSASTTDPVPSIEPVPRLALTRAEAAQALGLSVDGVDALLEAGKLRAIRPSDRRVIVAVSELRDYIRREMIGGGS